MRIQTKTIITYLLLLSLGIHQTIAKNMRTNSENINIEERIRFLQTVPLSEIQNQSDSLALALQELNSSISSLIPDTRTAIGQNTNVDQYIQNVFGVISQISYILSYGASNGLIFAGISLAFKYLASWQDQTTANSLNNLRQQVHGLSNQIQNLKVEVIYALNALDQNLAFRSIDQDIYILQSLLSQYNEIQDQPNSIIFFKQLCGPQLQVCNEAFLSLTNGLKDYLRTVRTSANWSRVTVSAQYITYASLLLNSITVLSDINLRIATSSLNLVAENISEELATRYSQTYLLVSSLNELKSDFDVIYSSTYEQLTLNVSINNSNWNDLTFLSTGLLQGIFRGPSGDNVNSITKTLVANRYDTKRSHMDINVASYLDATNIWFNCPDNSFLKAFYLSGNSNIYNIETFTCFSVGNFFYDTCQIVDVNLTASNSWATCPDGTFVAGFFKAEGEKIQHITRLNCCSLTSNQNAIVADHYNRRASSVYWAYPNGGTVNFENDNPKSPLATIKVFQKDLNGRFVTTYKRYTPGNVVENKQVDTLLTFDKPFNWGKCPQNFYLMGIQQNTGLALSHVEKFNCQRFENAYWKQCHTQQILQYNSLKSCASTNSCSASTYECEAGTYLVGFRRNAENNFYGIDYIYCCSYSTQNGLFKE